MDGFSTSAPILFGLSATPDTANLIPYTHIDAYAFANATTLLLDATTGDRIPHWTERDAFDRGYGRSRPPLLVMQPAVPLDPATRYIVVVTGVVDSTGAAIPAWPAFAALRDGTTDARVSADRVAWFESSVFPVIVGAGVARQSLQLAWDFTTRSMAAQVNRAIAVRDDALARIAAAPPSVQVDRVETFDCSATGQNVAKYVW